MNIQTETWYNSQGNFCFNWTGDNPKCFLVTLIIGIAIVVISVIVDFFFGTTYSNCAFGGILVALPCLYVWTNRQSKKEDRLMLSVVKEYMDGLIGAYISHSEKSIRERKRKVYIQTKGTYGIITGASILCWLSDGRVIEYALILHNLGERMYFELSKEPNVCTEDSKLKKVIPFYGIKKIVKSLSLSESSMLVVIIIAIVVFSFFSAFIFFGLLYVLGIKLFIVSFAIYLALTVVSHIAITRVKQLSIIGKILDFPMLVLGIIAEIGQPFIVIVASVISPIAAIIGPLYIIMSLIEKIVELKMSCQTQIFILLTVSQILCVHAPSFTRWIIKKSPLQNWENHRYEKYREELALYITSPKCYNFIFSFLYVVFLALSSIWQLEFHSCLISVDCDNAIIKAFLVFLAFSAMRQKTKEVDVKSKVILPKILGLFVHDENERHKEL